MKYLWKIKKKFKIRLVGPNLFMIEFDDADDLKLILEG